MSETIGFTIRLPEELHARLKVMAFVRDTSMNELIVNSLYEKYPEDPRVETIRKLVDKVRDEQH